MKFTFKTDKPRGPYSSFFSSQHSIKLQKQKCGSIGDKKPYKIRFQVLKDDIMEDGNPNCSWKWITLKKESTTLQEAKDFVNENFDAIMEKYKIYRTE
jgi:hypothetical protein